MRLAASLALFSMLAILPASAQTSTGSGSGAPTLPPPQTVLVCIPSTTGVAVSPCDVTGTAAMPSYVAGYVLSASDYQAFQVSTAPFDTATGAEYFSIGCGVVVSSWLLTFAIGLVFQAVRG